MFVSQAYAVHGHQSAPSTRTPWPIPANVGSCVSSVVTCVNANTKTRSKKSSRGVTLCSWSTAVATIARDLNLRTPRTVIRSMGLLAQNPRSPGERRKTCSVVGRLRQKAPTRRRPFNGHQSHVGNTDDDGRPRDEHPRPLHSASATTEQYDETIQRLEKSVDWPPEGLEFHIAFEAGGKLRVSEIWDSQAQFDAFGKNLMPILEDVGIDPGRPELLEIHNIIRR